MAHGVSQSKYTVTRGAQCSVHGGRQQPFLAVQFSSGNVRCAHPCGNAQGHHTVMLAACVACQCMLHIRAGDVLICSYRTVQMWTGPVCSPALH